MAASDLPVCVALADNGAKRVLLPRLEQHGALLKCLIVSEDLEVAALYGVLALVRHLQHPPGECGAGGRSVRGRGAVSEIPPGWVSGSLPSGVISHGAGKLGLGV